MSERSIVGEYQGFAYELTWQATGHNLNEYQVQTRVLGVIEHIIEQFDAQNEFSEVSRFNQWPATEAYVLTRELEELLNYGIGLYEMSNGDISIFTSNNDSSPADIEIANHLVTKRDDSVAVDLNVLIEGYIADRISDLFQLLRVSDYQISINGATRLRAGGRHQQRFGYEINAHPHVIQLGLPVNQALAYSTFLGYESDTSSIVSIIVIHENAAIARGLARGLMNGTKDSAKTFVQDNRIPVYLIVDENGEEKSYTNAQFREFLS
ncbi:MAG: FAD:protein FMN transferase [Aliidiomarina sp.]|uniref:FAD:protein FMN transferase n=1 Tax=Aliidiomarina sp. TaxID=1872439 RepID=UPI0025C2A664|nr:FAD:protein FMN transferase [Aliidiomarina sp.]MCH8501387.1 FAD:protein FMN transferase [Aliidiomarina sp.]